MIESSGLRPVEELQALCDAATPPVDSPSWVIERHGGVFEIYSGPLSEHSEDIAVGIYREENARFIAAARTALPSLLARLRAAEETLAAVGDEHYESDGQCASCRDWDDNPADWPCPTARALAEGASR